MNGKSDVIDVSPRDLSWGRDWSLTRYTKTSAVPFRSRMELRVSPNPTPSSSVCLRWFLKLDSKLCTTLAAFIILMTDRSLDIRVVEKSSHQIKSYLEHNVNLKSFSTKKFSAIFLTQQQYKLQNLDWAFRFRWFSKVVNLESVRPPSIRL